ncbi:hypothetical protein [Actinoplanes auranticolor]|uniref:ABC transporter n=1 Tax=Actinoplanes auranticolor TaxID=47988 RepID=A0A919VGE1_9ACTN|nr:hypothetical protein [Actinoplanes auranticolor]GIM63750.1 ABC transporter [Actinoplanes auranticolor]
MSALRAVTRAELTKITTLRAGWLVLGAILALQVLVEAQVVGLTADAVAKITPDGTIEIFLGRPEPARAALLEFIRASSLQMSVFLPVLAAVIAGQEFRGGQLRASLLAVPRRGRLLAAKLVAAAGYLTLAAVLIAAISTGFSHLGVREWDPGLPVSGDALLGQAGFILYAVLLGVSTYAIAVIARSTLAAIGVSLALITVTMTQVLAGAPGLDALFPVSAGRNLLLNPETSDLTSGPGQAVLVLVGWAVVTSLLAGLTLVQRDAR